MAHTPIERKKLDISYGVLEERGFRIASVTPALDTVSRRSLLAMTDHPLNFLDDRRAGLVRFAQFEDEMVAFYWSTVLYELGDGLYQIVPAAVELLHKGRWHAGADADNV